jgi:hypothetical protein
MLRRPSDAHQQTVSDSPAASIPLRVARAVARIAADAAAAAEQRGELRALLKTLKKKRAELTVTPEGALADAGQPVTSEDPDAQAALTLLATRLAAYGVEQLDLGATATEADLFDLVKLLATPPVQPDPQAFFAARAAAVDARAVPRRLRPRAAPDAAPDAAVDAAVAEAPSARPPARPSRPSGAQAVVAEPAAAPEPPAAPVPNAEAEAADPRSERLQEALPVPATDDAELRELFAVLQRTEAVEHLQEPLDRLAFLADLAFRGGRFDRLVEALTGLVAIEFEQLERDGSDERRREFARVLRRLASPLLLRQLAVLRHLRAADAQQAHCLQAILFRYGTDGAEALIDEWSNAATPEARAICLEALHGLRRTHDALFDQVRDTDELRVRLGIELLAELGDARAEQLVLEQLRHPEPRTRRAVAAALERFPTPAAFDALGVALIDGEATVRLRAVAALQRRGPAAVKALTALLDGEPDLEVLYAAIAALGVIGGADAVQALIRAANGETLHPRRRTASYRLQACAALAQIRTPQAMAAVQVLRDDRDREVREGSMRLVAQAARRGTTALRAVSAD